MNDLKDFVWEIELNGGANEESETEIEESKSEIEESCGANEESKSEIEESCSADEESETEMKIFWVRNENRFGFNNP